MHKNQFELLVFTIFYFVRTVLRLRNLVLVKPWFFRWAWAKAFDNAYWRGVEYWHRY
jgi:hypothetical protein